MKKHAAWLGALATIVALVLLNVLVFSRVSAEELRDFLGGFASWAPVAYVLCFVILPVFFFPVPLLAFAAGLLFGLVWGSVYTLVGAALNCAVMFWISRRLARDRMRVVVERKMPEKWRDLLFGPSGRTSFLLLIVLRLIPAVPYNLINYGMGLTQMRFVTYMLGSLIGIIPGTVLFINIGDKALDVSSPSFALAVVLLVLLLVITAVLGKRLFPDATAADEGAAPAPTEKEKSIDA